MTDKATMTFDQFVLSRLGGEQAAKTEYLRDVVGSGPDSTLREVLTAADQLGLLAWLEALSMRDLAVALGVPVGKAAKTRRTYAEIRAAIIEACHRCDLTVKEIAVATGTKSTTVERHIETLIGDNALIPVGDGTKFTAVVQGLAEPTA